MLIDNIKATTEETSEQVRRYTVEAAKHKRFVKHLKDAKSNRVKTELFTLYEKYVTDFHHLSRNLACITDNEFFDQASLDKLIQLSGLLSKTAERLKSTTSISNDRRPKSRRRKQGVRWTRETVC